MAMAAAGTIEIPLKDTDEVSAEIYMFIPNLLQYSYINIHTYTHTLDKNI